MANPEPQQESCCIIKLDEAWVTSLQTKANDAYQNRRVGKCTIFKVPRKIRKQDPDAYEPKIISLGPYHRSKCCLQAGNELKLHFLSLFLRRKSSVALQDYLRKLKTLEEKARSSYSEDIDMESNEFVEMLLLDGCFVLEFLLQFVERRYLHPFFETLGASNSIINDMLMLENQLPFFVLESIFDLAKSTEIRRSKSFKDLAFDLCKSVFPNGVRMPSEESVPRFYHLLDFLHSCLAPAPPLEESVPWFHHLLHFLHSCIAPTQQENAQSSTTTPESIPYALLLAPTQHQQQENAQSSTTTPESIPCAILLAEAGVKFRTTIKKASNPEFSASSPAIFEPMSMPESSASNPESSASNREFLESTSIKQASNPEFLASSPVILPISRVGLSASNVEFLESTSIKNFSNPGFLASSAEPMSMSMSMSMPEASNPENDFCLLDITFVNGVLSIPTLKIYDETNLLFRNLIAFEQCFPTVGNHVAAYSAFMDCIIDTPMDVALLRQNKVIENFLGRDEDAAILFNNLCKEVVINTKKGYLSDVMREVTRYCDSRWHRYRQKLMHDYFNSPWAIISLVAAVILLLLTAIQTVFSVIPYFKPPN